MSIYPITLLTNKSKNAWILCAYGKLQREHNIMGKWFDEKEPTITLEEYNKLRLSVRLAHPFGTVDKLSPEAWQEYLDNRFEGPHARILSEVCRMKLVGYESTAYDPDLEKI